MKFLDFIIPIDQQITNKWFNKLTKMPDEPAHAVEAPTTEIGTVIPVVFGTRIIRTPAIAWWGDVKIVKIKVSTKGKK